METRSYHNNTKIRIYDPFQEVQSKTVTTEPQEFIQILNVKRTDRQRALSYKIQRSIRRQQTVRTAIEKKITEASEQLTKQKEVKEKILQNYTFKDIDVFYRPCFDYNKPFNPQLYYYELARIKHREQQVKKLKEEINEDKLSLENYKQTTTKNIYVPKNHQTLSTCTDPTLVMLRHTVSNATQ
jgi:hypothetical protein